MDRTSRGDGEHDFADMPRLLHQPKRRRRLAQRKNGVDRRLQLSGLEERQEFAQHRAGPGRAVLDHAVEREHVIRDIRPGRSHPLRTPDALLADLHEATARREHFQALRDELSGKAVQHNINASFTGGGLHLGGESKERESNTCFHTEGMKHVPFAGGRGEDGGRRYGGDLQRCNPTPPRRGIRCARPAQGGPAASPRDAPSRNHGNPVAACSKVSSLGLRTSREAGTFADSARQPRAEAEDRIAWLKHRHAIANRRHHAAHSMSRGQDHRDRDRGR